MIKGLPPNRYEQHPPTYFDELNQNFDLFISDEAEINTLFADDTRAACSGQFINKLQKLLQDRCISKILTAGYNNNSHVKTLIDNLRFSYVAGSQIYRFDRRIKQFYKMFTSTFDNPSELQAQGEGYKNVAICYCEGKNWWLDREVEIADVHDWDVIRLNCNPSNSL